MEAKPAGPTSYIEIKHVCEGCILHAGHEVAPDMVRIESRHTPEQIETLLSVSSKNGEVNTTNFTLPGVIRREKIVERFNQPAESVDGATLACNAMCVVLMRERENYGREEIPT